MNLRHPRLIPVTGECKRGTGRHPHAALFGLKNRSHKVPAEIENERLVFSAKADICTKISQQTMSQIELYQSVLAKLGRLPFQELAELDAYLSVRLRRKTVQRRVKTAQSNVSKVAGAWKDWDNSEFEDFLRVLRQTREEMFADRNFQL